MADHPIPDELLDALNPYEMFVAGGIPLAPEDGGRDG